jgi:hypothetical protein
MSSEFGFCQQEGVLRNLPDPKSVAIDGAVADPLPSQIVWQNVLDGEVADPLPSQILDIPVSYRARRRHGISSRVCERDRGLSWN